MRKCTLFLALVLTFGILSCKGGTSDQSVWDVVSRPQNATVQEPYSLSVKGICNTCRSDSWSSIELEDVDGLRMLWDGPYGNGQCPEIGNIYLFPGERIEIRLSVAGVANGGKAILIDVPQNNGPVIKVSIDLD
jgi:hypothetical protein